MRESEQLSVLIGRIYDASLDPASWVDTLDQTAGFVGGPAASLYCRDADKLPPIVYNSGIDPRYVQLFLDTYAKLDPTSTGYFLAKLEEPTSTADVMPYDEFLQTRFYREWAHPQGLVDTAHVMLERSARASAAFVVFRHERDGLVDDGTRQRMRLVVPHIRRAALIGRTLDLKTAQAATFVDVLDGIRAGMLLVDATGHLAHANLAGHAMLADSEFSMRPADGSVPTIRIQTRYLPTCSPPPGTATRRSASRASRCRFAPATASAT